MGNIFDSNLAREGFAYLSFNASAARLLLPDSLLYAVEDMSTAKYVVMSCGKWKGQDADGVELMFEDGNDAPFSLLLCLSQMDRSLAGTNGRELPFSV